MAEQREAIVEIRKPDRHVNLAEALAAFQAELPRIRKDETAKVTGEGKNGPVKYTYGYAGLDAVVEAVMPVLGKHGLSITSSTRFDQQGNFMLEVNLVHENGQRETGIWPLPDPRKFGPQDLGSAMTYGRRYLTLALTGTFPGGEDDDGQKAQQSARDSWEDARPRRQVDDRQAQAGQEPQAAPAEPAPKTSWTDAEVTDYQVKIAAGPLDLSVKGYDWMATKDLHNRTVDTGAQANTATKILAVRLAEEALADDNSVATIDGLKAIAADRGLLKEQVSATETLAEVLHGARDLAAYAAVEQAKADTPDPQAE